jgi:hypothetical protein
MLWLALVAPLLASEDQLGQVEEQTADWQGTESSDPNSCETEFETECLIKGIVGSSLDRCSPACQVYYSQLSYECYDNYKENFQWKAMQEACDPQGLKQWTPPDDGGSEDDQEGKTREDLGADATESFAGAPAIISSLAVLLS